MSKKEKLWKNELDALLGKLVDDGLTVADKARLNDILQAEPEALGSMIGAVKVKLHRLRRQLLGCIQNRMQEDGI